MPQAARVSDLHTCPMCDGPKPHVGGPILPPGAPTVLIEGLPAAKVGDLATCLSPAPDVLIMGSATVLIEKRYACRVGDQTAHGGTVSGGASKVLIGIPGDGVQVGLKGKGGSGASSARKAKSGEKSKGEEGGKGERKDEGLGDGSKEIKPVDPMSCPVNGIAVYCDHDSGRKRAPAGGVLQLVGTGSEISLGSNEDTSAGSAGWYDPGIKFAYTHGGAEQVIVENTPNQCSKCGSSHGVALTASGQPPEDGLWTPGDRGVFDVSWNGEEPIWPLSQPRIWHAFARGCDHGQARSCRVEVFQPTKVKVTLGADGYGERHYGENDESTSKLVNNFFARTLNFFRLEGPKFEEPQGSVTLAWGYEEVPADSRVMFKVAGEGRFEFGVSVRGYANLVALASAIAAAPLAMISRFIEYGIEVELFLGGAIGLSVGTDLQLSRYASDGFGGGFSMVGDLTVTAEAGLKLQAGFEWLQSIGIEAGTKSDLGGSFRLEINDRGIFASLNARRGPVVLFVKMVAKGWFWNHENTFTFEVLKESEIIWGEENMRLYAF